MKFSAVAPCYDEQQKVEAVAQGSSDHMSDKRKRLILASFALFAMVWAIVRACIQAVTIDEACTYVIFVRSSLLFVPAANNHILNTVLMWLSTHFFGVSELTLRLPALIGAGLYITAAYCLCRLLSRSLALQVPLLVCLVYNPFIFDYLVAARGYALALGLLMWAIVVPARWFLSDRDPKPRSLAIACEVSSACMGLSIAANFAFAFVDFITLTVIFLCAAATRKLSLRSLFMYCYVPGAVVILGVTGCAMFGMPKDEFIWGATSLATTFGEIMQHSFDYIPLNVANWAFFVSFIWLALAAASSAWVLFVLSRQDRNSPLFRFALLLMLIVAATAAVHWTAFHFFGLLLPRDRTAIYFFPLCMLAVGALAAIPPPTRLAQYLRNSVLGVMIIMATCFLLCLRLTYFREWRWNADVKQAYSVLDCIARKGDVRNVSACALYVGALNFYRIQSSHSSLAEILDDRHDSRDVQAYVLNTFFDNRAFFENNTEVLKDRGLKVIYRGRPLPDGVGRTVIAIKPELGQVLPSEPCFQ